MLASWLRSRGFGPSPPASSSTGVPRPALASRPDDAATPYLVNVNIGNLPGTQVPGHLVECGTGGTLSCLLHCVCASFCGRAFRSVVELLRVATMLQLIRDREEAPYGSANGMDEQSCRLMAQLMAQEAAKCAHIASLDAVSLHAIQRLLGFHARVACISHRPDRSGGERVLYDGK